VTRPYFPSVTQDRIKPISLGCRISYDATALKDTTKRRDQLCGTSASHFGDLEIPRWNPGPGISWLGISVVLHTHCMEIPGLYCLKLLIRTLQSAPFHFSAIIFNAIQSELLTVSLTNEHNKKAVRFLRTIPGTDTIGWEGKGGGEGWRYRHRHSPNGGHKFLFCVVFIKVVRVAQSV
jgi:hypothetical protein